MAATRSCDGLRLSPNGVRTHPRGIAGGLDRGLVPHQVPAEQPAGEEDWTLATLLGRERERRALDDLLEGVHDHGGALLLRGEAGIGKSSLLEAARDRARELGFRVLVAEGVQSESRLPFAGLHQLLRPILSHVERLPPPQHDAMVAAFGESFAAAPDLFLIALATLDLLADTAAEAPLLLIAEDAQWLDGPSCDVLAFVARRLESDRIILLAAIRDGFDSVLVEAGLPELHLEGLDTTAATALLDRHGRGLPAAARERVLRDAAGNPLALVELPVALRSARLGAEGEPLPEQLPLTTRLERAFAARVSELPASTRTLLLVAAVDDGGVLPEVMRAAGSLAGTDLTALAAAPAAAAGLIDVGDAGLRFRHPLVRSAILQATTVIERQAAHAAMAKVLERQPDRQVWHRAASIVGWDEEVASELESTAMRAQRRAAIAVALAALERAARLSDPAVNQGRRLLHAAELAFELGRHDHGSRLIRDAEPLELDRLDRTRVSWLRESFEDGPWSGAAKIGSLIEIADRMRLDGDLPLALNFLRAAGFRCWWSNPDADTRERVVAAAERMPVPDDHPDVVATLAFAAPVERGALVIDRLRRLAVEGRSGGPGAAGLYGTAADAVGATDLAAGFLAASAAGLRAQGRLGLLARVLVSQAWVAIRLGNWNVALPAADEATRLARETSQVRWEAAARLGQATVAALRGDEETAIAIAAEVERVLVPMFANSMLSLVQLARGLGALGAGRHDDAYGQLRRVFDPADVAHHPFVRWWVVVDLAEAAAHGGSRDEARAWVAELEPLAARSRSPLLTVGLSCARPLLASDDDAESLFEAAMRADLGHWPLFRARLQLAYGAWLRRQRRVAESRAPLQAAREASDALGIVPWSDRARQELRASGVRSRRRTAGAWDQLSPQELQIARMAAAGLSNREIGQKLYLSHRTVGSHLYRIFPKLGVTARSELRGLAEESAE